MECEVLAEMLTDLLEGDVEEDQEAAALAHLASCEQCERVLAETRDVISLAHEFGRAELDAEDRARMFRELNTRSTK